MVITNVGILKNSVTNQRVTKDFSKATFTSEGAGTWHSLWQLAGLPGAGATPATGNGAIPTDATTGGMGFNNAAGTDNNYMGYFSNSGTLAGSLILYDRLWHNSGIVGNIITTQSFTSTALTRSTSGEGVELWGEFYSAMGAVASTLTVVYTDQSGGTGNSATYAAPANAETVGQMVPFTLAVGDYGVRAVASATWSISRTTAGDMGLTLLKRIATIPINTGNKAAVFDAISCGLRDIPDDACLAFMVQSTAASACVVGGTLDLIAG